MIDELLDMSRIVAGKLQIDPQRIEIVPVVEAALATVGPAAVAKGVDLAVRLPEGGPMVLGDANRLQQVFWNLASNAVKFTPRGGRVDVEVVEREDEVLVRVSDSGAGIAPEFLPHVFERFRQADSSTTRRHGGLGLGLAIVRQLVDLHGGTVSAASEGVGKGSRFEVSLPRAAKPSAHDGAHLPEIATEPPVDDGMPLIDVTVLAIDDQADTRDLLTRLLQASGALVLAAGSAAEGLSLLSRARPAVVICDIGMPGSDGYNFIRRVRDLPAERGGRTPAIALTALARAEDRERALAAGYDLHLPKPVEGGTLLAAVMRFAGLPAAR
jgi:CheY-like chemotaxis protein